MPSYRELLAQKKELDQRIEEVRQQDSKEALARIEQLIATFGFTVHQVFPLPQQSKKKVADKYYDPDSGQSWSGRGRPPQWIEGKDRSEYEIKVEPKIDFTAPRDSNNPFPVQ